MIKSIQLVVWNQNSKAVNASQVFLTLFIRPPLREGKETPNLWQLSELKLCEQL